jgi:hypothetical protein
VVEPGMINDLNPRRPATEVDPVVKSENPLEVPEKKIVVKVTDKQRHDFERKRFEREEKG